MHICKHYNIRKSSVTGCLFLTSLYKVAIIYCTVANKLTFSSIAWKWTCLGAILAIKSHSTFLRKR